MDIAYIDQLACNGEGYLHRASVISKIVFCILVLVSVMMSRQAAELMIIFAALAFLTRLSGLSLTGILHFCLYPAFFSLPFSMTRFEYSVWEGLSVTLKSVDAAMVMVLLMTTTPYTQVFSFFRLFLPSLVVDGMFFTYRTFFILVEKVGNILTVVKLRGGFLPSNILFTIKNLAGAIGILFINSFDMLERMYSIYSLRGYEGRIYSDSRWYVFKRPDFIPIGMGMIILGLVVAF